MNNKKIIVVLLIVSATVLYLFFSSTIIVKPGTVVIVNELIFSTDQTKLVSRPFINDGEKNKLFFKQPVIPGTGIGYIEEIYDSNSPYDFKTSFALYTLDQLTGNEEDRNKVRAYTISGKIKEISNWDNFLNKLNVEELNNRRSPYSRKYNSRVEILAEQLKFLLRTSNPEQYYPYGAGTKDSVMNLGQKINFLQQELVSRRNFLAGIKDKFNFPDADLYRQYLISNAPWYWVFGIDEFENLINQSKNLREYEQSIYSQIISRKGNANKYINNEDYLYLINMSGKIHYYEQNLMQNEQTLKNLDTYFKQLYREILPNDLKMGESISRDFELYLKRNNMTLIDLDQGDITQTIARYIDEDLFYQLTNAVNYEKLLLNLEYLGTYKDQILNTYEYSESDFEEVDRTYNFLLENYSEVLEKENWENYLNSVNSEFSKYLELNPNVRIPDEKIQILTNYKLYDYYLSNIEPSLRRNQIDSNHNLYSLMETINTSPNIFLSDKDTVDQLIASWLQNPNAAFLTASASIISYKWQIERTNSIIENLDAYKARELDPFILYESRNYDLKESELLWNAAIENILHGADLSVERPFAFHNVKQNETISSIGELYNMNPFDIFYDNRFDLQFKNPATRSEMNSKMEYEDYNRLFDTNKIIELKRDQEIYIPNERIYSDSWLNLHESKKDLREFLINQYVFTNLEKMVPLAFNDFVHGTDYVQNLEHDYGVKFEQLSFVIEDRNIFSNPRTGEIDNDFIDLYYQKTLR